MNIIQLRHAALPAAGLLAVAITAGCNAGSDVSVIDEDVPPSARIGNVASADLRPVGNSGASGTATFATVDDGLMIQVEIEGVTAGRHGVHVHENGDCTAPDASSAGGHFSPDSDTHGSPASAEGQHHAGDLGNLTAGADGTGELTHEDPDLTLIGTYGVIGRAVIVHQREDDLMSQPGGNAGERIACGVIEAGPDLTFQG